MHMVVHEWLIPIQGCLLKFALMEDDTREMIEHTENKENTIYIV